MATARPILGLIVAAAMVVAAGCNRAPEVLTPEAAKARGDAMLQEMSKNLSARQILAYTSDERREVVKGGTKHELRTSRRIVVRRPNALTFTTKGEERDGQGWYDGKQLTLISNRAKVWARGPMPGTLDEALDFLTAEYDIRMATADLLYANPYDALMTSDTTGGWVDVQKIGERNCDHLAYQQPVVDWEIWLAEGTRAPCQARIVYKNEPDQPATIVTYAAFEEAPAVSDDTFAAKIPDGYQRIKIMRRATVEDPNLAAPPSEPAKQPR